MIRSDTTKKIATNTAFQIFGKVASMSITILATVIVTRMYGREGYGEFSLMQNIPALFFVIVDFGFNAIAVRELSRNFQNAEKYLGTVIILRFFSSLLLMLFASMVITFFPYSPSLKLGIYLSMLLILTQALYATTNIIFQVKLRYDLSTIGYIAGSLTVLVLVLVFSKLNLDIMWVNFSYVIGGGITFMINVLFLRKFIDLSKSLAFDPIVFKYILIQALPIGLMFVFSQINFKSDSIFLSILKVPSSLGLSNTEAVAVYTLPYKIFEVALVVPTFLMNSVYPVFVRHLEESPEKFKSTFFKTASFLFAIGIVGAAFGVLLAPFAILILGGSEFSQSITVLKILIIGLPIFYLTQPISWLLVTLKSQKYLPFIYAVSALFNVLMNFFLIPRYSFYASSMLTWLSELIILGLLIFFAQKTWKLNYA